MVHFEWTSHRMGCKNFATAEKSTTYPSIRAFSAMSISINTGLKPMVSLLRLRASRQSQALLCGYMPRKGFCITKSVLHTRKKGNLRVTPKLPGTFGCTRKIFGQKSLTNP